MAEMFEIPPPQGPGVSSAPRWCDKGSLFGGSLFCAVNREGCRPRRPLLGGTPSPASAAHGKVHGEASFLKPAGLDGRADSETLSLPLRDRHTGPRPLANDSKVIDGESESG